MFVKKFLPSLCFQNIEIEELKKHGTMLPPDIMGLTDEQVEELRLKDEWGEKCTPMGGFIFNKDAVGTDCFLKPLSQKHSIIIFWKKLILGKNIIMLFYDFHQVVEMENSRMKRCKRF